MKKRNKLLIALTALTLVLMLLVASFYTGLLQINNLSRSKFPVRGVDVSSYQGDIDWEILSKENISFAYIKATEGSSHTDPRFLENWSGATQTDLFVGAYHFFSFDSSGETQAKNFTDIVPRSVNALPHAVDLEFYGAYNESNLSQTRCDEIISELLVFTHAIEAYYGVKPVIYVTEETYLLFEMHKYDFPLWIRSVYSKPSFIANDEWHFWQYSNRTRLRGYQGEEVYIDMNAFFGSFEEFYEFIGKKD